MKDRHTWVCMYICMSPYVKACSSFVLLLSFLSFLRERHIIASYVHEIDARVLVLVLRLKLRNPGPGMVVVAESSPS